MSCVIFPGTKTPKGYGMVYLPNLKRVVGAHVLAWESIHGPVPKPLTIDHLCRNPACINVNHLELVTKRENTLRGIGPSAINARKTKCIRGHEFSPENTRYKKTGARICIECDRQRCLASYYRCREQRLADQKRYYAARKATSYTRTPQQEQELSIMRSRGDI